MSPLKMIAAFLCAMLVTPGFCSQMSHIVILGKGKPVAFPRSEFSSDASVGQTNSVVRPLLVDGQVKEWTVGPPHNVTDRTFVVRRASRVNDALPDERRDRWVWESGPWLLIDRLSGHVTVLHLPDYNPALSKVVWFRDYAAYCGVSSTGKSLNAVVFQIGARKATLSKELKALTFSRSEEQSCPGIGWQKDPLRVVFREANGEERGFNVVGNLAIQTGEGEEDNSKDQ